MAIYEVTTEPAAIDFECGGNKTLARTIQHAKNLLMLRKGELPFDRNRGLDTALFDLPLDKLQARLPAEVSRLMELDPDLTLARAWAERTEDGETVIHAMVSTTVGE